MSENTPMDAHQYYHFEKQQENKPLLSGVADWGTGERLIHTQDGGWAALHTRGQGCWQDRWKFK